MRLWHQELIPVLPRQQLLGQHRECCALRGNGWSKNHSVVNYVFTYPMEKLYVYHILVMDEMNRRGYNIAPEWRNPNYRGKKCTEYKANIKLINEYSKKNPVYKEHNDDYLDECIDNLKRKDIKLNRGDII